MKLYDANKAKLSQLAPASRLPALQWMKDCWLRGLVFRVDRVYVSQADWDALYASGRRTPGSKIVCVQESKHTARTAVDVTPLSGGLEAIEAVAAAYGVYTEICSGCPVLLTDDRRHFVFDRAKSKPVARGLYALWTEIVLFFKRLPH